jgi:DNA-binding GntR family transcriptional regulator
MLWVRDLVPNQKLRYQDIVRHLEMSQTPVILALAKLEGEGLVRSEPNKGFYVPELDLVEARELYDMREAIEISLVSQAASRINDRQLALLYGIMKEHQSYNSAYYTLELL